jgi:hypothetical protein
MTTTPQMTEYEKARDQASNIIWRNVKEKHRSGQTVAFNLGAAWGYNYAKSAGDVIALKLEQRIEKLRAALECMLEEPWSTGLNGTRPVDIANEAIKADDEVAK